MVDVAHHETLKNCIAQVFKILVILTSLAIRFRIYSLESQSFNQEVYIYESVAQYRILEIIQPSICNNTYISVLIKSVNWEGISLLDWYNKVQLETVDGFDIIFIQIE